LLIFQLSSHRAQECDPGSRYAHRETRGPGPNGLKILADVDHALCLLQVSYRLFLEKIMMMISIIVNARRPCGTTFL
jgi:hypothetical protein